MKELEQIDNTSSNLFSEVKHYKKLSQDFQLHLQKFPFDWPKFQQTFNSTVEKITVDILQFEKENISKYSHKVNQLKAIFEKRYRGFFLYGEYPRWVFEKPYGYAGDFKIIDNIYRNQSQTTGFDRLWDNYFLQMAACRATRERKEELKKFILDFVKKHKNQNIDIMNLGSGGTREIKELLDTDSEGLFSKVTFDCYDFDSLAISFAIQLLNNNPSVNFHQKNAIRIALKKDITKEMPKTYDFIYSVGLFDYLNDRIAIKLVANLKKLLKKNGVMVIANFGDKYNNPSAGLMEWATEWYLIYRDGDKFSKIFLDAGFEKENLQIITPHHKVIQYAVLKGSKSIIN